MGGSRAPRHPPQLGLYVGLVIRHLTRYIFNGNKRKERLLVRTNYQLSF